MDFGLCNRSIGFRGPFRGRCLCLQIPVSRLDFAFAEFERAMIRERVLAGLARAKEQGTRLGRRRIEDADAAKAVAIRAAPGSGKGIRRIAFKVAWGRSCGWAG